MNTTEVHNAKLSLVKPIDVILWLLNDFLM